jgi:hypothetical protein
MASATTFSGGSSSSYINGPLAMTVASTSSTVRTYPIGKGSAFRSVTMTITQDAATATAYTAEVFNTAPTSRALAAGHDRVSNDRYYTVTKGVGANVTNASIQLSYDTDDTVSDEISLRIAKDDGAGNWVDLGGTGSASPAGTITSTNNFTSFSDFVLANATGGGNVLPVQLSSFQAVANRAGVVLTWETGSELNNYGFDIERRAVGADLWAKVGFVPGAGTSSSSRLYTFSDRDVTPGRYAYRIKQLDHDGGFSFSSAVEIEIGLTPRELMLGSNYPNPFNPETTIEFTLPDDGRALLKVYNTLGQEIATIFDAQASAGRIYQARFNGASVPSGVYYYVLDHNGQRVVRNFVLMK